MKKREIEKRLKKLIDVLDGLIGDTEPDIEGLTEDEVIEYEPNYFIMLELVTLFDGFRLYAKIKGEINNEPSNG